MTKVTSSKNKWWKIFLSLTMALMLALSLFAMAACNNSSGSDDDDEEEEETLVDEQIIKNGNFEFVGTEPTYPVTSINNWSKSYASTMPDIGKNNPTSKFTSGVIDVKGLDGLSFVSDDEEDEQLNNLKKIGLNTRFTDDELEENGSNILMLANKYENDVKGTAQKATSSTTLTINAGTAIKVSVWVRTNGLAPDTGDYTDKALKDAEGNSVAGTAGAYIGVNNTVGSTTAAPMYITNIDTDGEWQQYTMIIRASDYTTAKVQLVLGLGMGYALTETESGPQGNPSEYVEGFAFFDDITYEVMPLTASSATDIEAIPYNHTTYNAVNELSVFAEPENAGDLPSELREKTDLIKVNAANANELTNIGTAEKPEYAIKLSFARITIDENMFDSDPDIDNSEALSKTVTDTGTVTAPDNNAESNLSLSGIYSYDSLKVQAVYQKQLEKFPFGPANILALRAKTPTALTSTLTNNGSDFVLAPEKYASISLWIKTSEIKSGEGAGFTVVDKGANLTDPDDWVKTSFSAIDTTTIENDPDYYDGWTKYTFYLYNDSKTEDRTFGIELTFGLTTQSSNVNSYNTGWALFTNLFIEDEVPEAIYNAATAGTYVKKATLNAQTNIYSSDTGFDTISPSGRYDSAGNEIIKTKPVIPNSYVGTIGGTNKTGARDNDGNPIIANPEETAATSVIRGLINYRHIADYAANGLTGIDANVIGNAIQPLVIQNNAPATYGYISKSSRQLSANSITALTIDVRVLGNAKAYIYLTSSKPADDFKILSIDRPAVDNSDNDRTPYDEETRPLVQVIDGSRTNEWVRVRFYVITGNEAVDYNIELWNGSRDGKIESEGTVLFDRLSVNTSFTQETYDAYLKLIKEDTSADIVKFTQQAREFYMTEEELEEEAEHDHSDDEEEDVDSYKEMIMYAYKAPGATAADSDYIMFLNYTTINVSTAHSHGDEETPDDETAAPKNNAQIWLMISSLILAVVLIFVLLLVFFKRLKVRLAKKKIESTTRYKGKRIYKRKSKDEIDELEIEDDSSDEQPEEADQKQPAIKIAIDEDIANQTESDGEDSE